MSLAKRITSLVVAAGICTVSLCGCSKAGREYETVSADSPWFDYSMVTIGEEFDNGEYDYVEHRTLGATTSSIAVLTMAERAIEDYTDDINFEDYCTQFISLYSYDGELLSREEIPVTDENGDYVLIEGAVVEDDRIRLLTAGWDSETNTMYSCLDGELIAPDIEDASSTYVEKICLAGDKMICMLRIVNNYGVSRNDIGVLNDDGSVRLYLGDDSRYGWVDLYDIYPIDSHRVIAEFYDMEGAMNILIDLDTGEITEFDDVDIADYYQFFSTPYGMISEGLEGIGLFNYDDETTTPIMAFDQCNVSLTDISQLQPVFVNESATELVLAGQVESDLYYSSNIGIYKILKLTKADSNPNAGKTILTVQGNEFLTYGEALALNKFNETNSDFFLRYRMAGTVQTEDEFLTDVLSGDCADIILNMLYYDQLNTDDYLVDLDPYISGPNGIDMQDYFSNAVNAAGSSEGLYQMPADIEVFGIITASANMPSGRVGFTFDEYEQFVDQVCNGTDPMSLTSGYTRSKSEYFTALFANMYDVFVSNGTAYLDNDAFRELLVYVDQNVNEVISEEIGGSSVSDSIELHNSMVAQIDGLFGSQFGSFSGFGRYLNLYERYEGELGIYGMPSFDGRGPSIRSEGSVGISASCEYPDAAWEYIKILLSPEVQEDLGGSTNPICISALRNNAQAELDGFIEIYSYESDGSTLPLPDESMIDDYIDILMTASTRYECDPSVERIVHEEATAYFSGTRAIDDVIPVVQDRVQTVLNERQ